MNERLSCFKDSELEEEELASVMDAAKLQPQVRERWHLYSLIGDTLRQERGLEFNVLGRVMAELDAEPTVLAPVVRRNPVGGRMRWALPLAASFMGVAAVAWVAQSVGPAGGGVLTAARSPVIERVVEPVVASSASSQPAAVPPVATAASPREVAAAQPVIPVSERFEREYLLAHQAYATSPSMSGVVQYVRTVSEARDEPSR